MLLLLFVIVHALAAVKKGMDVVETDYPFRLTESGVALCLPSFEQFAEMEMNRDDTSSEECNENTILLPLHDLRFQLDQAPVDSRCLCLCCRNHSRAYLHHLLQTQEMLFNILLNM